MLIWVKGFYGANLALRLWGVEGGYFKNFLTGVCGPNLEDLESIHIKAKPEKHIYLYNLT